VDAGKLIDMLFPRGEGGGGAKETWLIVGLGNPGPKYKDTRHNVAWWALDDLAERANVKFGKRSGDAETAEAQIGEGSALLVRPMTYVNLSGKAVSALMRKRGVPPERVIVISDDINLEPGKIRIRKQGGAGGHNGLKSVIDSLGTNEFARIRIGIGLPPAPDDQVDYVLGRMPPKERELVRDAASRAADAVEAAIRDGLDEAMNRFNG
jgi:PTH1 family peptidyl-tRNA hydrolase